jgi:trimeric autotransporter adhesin
MTMKSRKLQLLPAVVLLLSLVCGTTVRAQITPSADAYTNTTTPTTNYGSKPLLDVDGATQISYIQFNLTSIPAGSSVSQATLKLYVNAVTTAGSLNVDYVNGTWAESTITSSSAPALGSAIASGVPITTADKNQYVLINVTSAVAAWLNGSQTNDGIALVADGSFNATFDSKENTTTSHTAELDIVFSGSGGGGTITGVLTGSGSGLTGGGTSGTLNLSLSTACAAKQVLQWSGSAWVCAAAGTGTISGVTAGTDLTGGGTSGTVTLNLDTTKVPQLNAANTFNASQTVNGNLSTTGFVSGSSYQIGSILFAFGSSSNANAFLGFSGNPSMTGTGNTATGVSALESNTLGPANTASGYGSLKSNTIGSSNTADGFGSLFNNNVGGYNTATGYEALFENTSGGSNTASGSQALQNNSTGAGNTGMGFNSGYPKDNSSITGSNNSFLGTVTALSTGSLNNATAIGAYAFVAESNALVLGSINGVNGAIANTKVGIGTTTPQAELDVAGSSLETFIGDPGCGSHPFAGLGFGSTGLSSCQNYSMVGDGVNTYVAAPTGTIFFRTNSNAVTAMTINVNGDVNIAGSLSKGSGSFKIDHPLDPANKYLYHSFVESPDMMNIYNGVAILDAHGSAWITLPDYFEALNRDFRYQLTAIGAPGPNLYIVKKVFGNRFKIGGGKPKGEVSWQVTGIRQDAYANAHRIPNDEEKPADERGRYLHPELFGASEDQAIGYRPSTSSTAADQVAVGKR